MNISEALKLAGDYADSLTTADDITNRDTMAVAAALDAAYESGEPLRAVPTPGMASPDASPAIPSSG